MDWQRYQRHVLRYVEKQSLITTSDLVDRQADQVQLEALLEGSKPPTGDAHALHWLLRSPFRYPPLPYGSRFGRHLERGVFYASETRRALEAEAAFYSFKFFQDMVVPPPSPIRREFTVIRAKLSTDRLIDIAGHADVDRLVDPQSWRHSQPFGTRARGRGGSHTVSQRSAAARHPQRALQSGGLRAPRIGASRRTGDLWGVHDGDRPHRGQAAGAPAADPVPCGGYPEPLPLGMTVTGRTVTPWPFSPMNAPTRCTSAPRPTEHSFCRRDGAHLFVAHRRDRTRYRSSSRLDLHPIASGID
jgi:hypothetical protein